MQDITDKTITIVSGLPRSGTSLMMKMLEAGGMDVVIDNIRQPDKDNPNGYYECEQIKKIKDDTSWLPATYGKVFKMVSMLLMSLPSEYPYQVLFMKRDVREVIASQKKMLARHGKQSVSDDTKMELMYTKHLYQVEEWLSSQNNFHVLNVSFADLIRQSQREIKRIIDFTGKNFDLIKMKQVIDPSLYRNKVKDLI